MKKIIDIYSASTIEVDDDAIECSVCGKWEPRSSYEKDGEIVRTNCFDCCNNTTYLDFPKIKEEVKQLKQNPKYKQLIEIQRRNDYYFTNSVSVEEMIECLQKLPSGSRLLIDSHTRFGGVDFPDKNTDKIATPDLDKVYYYIGHCDCE
jgi:hypothetical protein